MDEPKLRNCPFCGGEAELRIASEIWSSGGQVEICGWKAACHVCGIETAPENRETAVEKWNRRLTMSEKNCDNCANEFCAFIPPDGKAYCDLLRSNAPAVNRWISVEDALPEIKEFRISDTVLCYCDSGVLAIARLEENEFGQVGFNCEKGDEYLYPAGKVLYWIPIPEIPDTE